jgi:DNA-binding NtrC family response regulator
LEAAATEGRFRRDLYDLIGAIRIAIPPLRDRPNDILPLAQSFMREFSEAFHRDIKGFRAEAEQALLNHRWRGNVRELRNRVERAVAMSRVQWIDAEGLFPSEATEGDGDRQAALAEVLDRVERQHIRTVLADVDDRTEEAAKRLGLARWVRRRRSGGGDPGSEAPLAPTPVMPDRPKPRSGGAAADVEVTAEPPADVVARRTVLPFQLHSDARCADKD